MAFTFGDGLSGQLGRKAESSEGPVRSAEVATLAESPESAELRSFFFFFFLKPCFLFLFLFFVFGFVLICLTCFVVVF